MPHHAAPAPPPASAVVNIPNAAAAPLRSSLRDEPGFDELIELYLDGVPEKRRRLREAVGRSDWAALGDLAHRLAGSAAGYGFGPAGEAAARVADAVREERRRDAVSAAGDLDGLLRRLAR